MNSSARRQACLLVLLACLLVATIPLAVCAVEPETASAQPNTLSPAELAEGWILLFDGKTLFGWEAASKANWAVVDGAIVVSQGERGLLNTTTRFENYVLKVDFRAAKGTNSGLFLRTPARPTNPAVDCYELNIAPNDNPFPTGSFVARKKAVAVQERTDWQTMEATCDGGRFHVKLNGKPVLEYVDEKPLGPGRIGLQFNTGQVAFRSIRLKPLGTRSLFNGRDLAGWNTDHADKSVFRVTDKGEINVKNGRGQLETDGRYADFVLQLEAFSGGRGLNSGIFFRCIPGDIMMGYEAQIHNGFKNGDRTQPQDCGTGGIFRRQNARFVVPDDFQWFHMTIAADGPHMATWVDGIQVSDWTDTREPDENPRKGRRLKAGTIMIQGHDPTTDLSFRNLRIAEQK